MTRYATAAAFKQAVEAARLTCKDDERHRSSPRGTACGDAGPPSTHALPAVLHVEPSRVRNRPAVVGCSRGARWPAARGLQP